MIILTDKSASLTGSVLRFDFSSIEKLVDQNLMSDVQGIGSTELPRGANAKCSAIHHEKGSLYFLLDESRWEVTDDLNFIVVERYLGLKRTFRLMKNDAELYSVTYWNPRFTKLLNYADILYDEFDKEADDFFYFLSNNCNSVEWRKEFLEKWKENQNQGT